MILVCPQPTQNHHDYVSKFVAHHSHRTRANNNTHCCLGYVLLPTRNNTHICAMYHFNSTLTPCPTCILTFVSVSSSTINFCTTSKHALMGVLSQIPSLFALILLLSPLELILFVVVQVFNQSASLLGWSSQPWRPKSTM